MPKPICSIPDCGRPHNAQGYCHGHYFRFRKHGHPMADIPLRPKRPKNMAPTEVFRYVMQGDPPADGCWEWAGITRDRKGYGIISSDSGRGVRAHRLAYEMFVGRIPDGLIICHHCDNPPCCNPAHLYAGTIKQNSDDMAVRDRSTRGERNALAKLTQGQVDEIRRRYVRRVVTHKMLAEQYGVTPSAICLIVNGKNWRPVRSR